MQTETIRLLASATSSVNVSRAVITTPCGGEPYTGFKGMIPVPQTVLFGTPHPVYFD